MTQHELDRKKLSYERRHFDKMSTPKVIWELVWRERVLLLAIGNIAWLTHYITHNF